MLAEWNRIERMVLFPSLRVCHLPLPLRSVCVCPCTISKKCCRVLCSLHKNSVSIRHEAMPRFDTGNKIFV